MDVLKCLGLTTGSGEHYKKLNGDEHTNVSRIALGMKPGKPAKVVTESGLYKLIMRSDKQEARRFQDWVTRGRSCRPSAGREANLPPPLVGPPV